MTQSYWSSNSLTEEQALTALKGRGFKIYDHGNEYRIILSPEEAPELNEGRIQKHIGLEGFIYDNDIAALGELKKIYAHPFFIVVEKKKQKTAKPKKQVFKCANKQCRAKIYPNKNGPWIGECPYCGSLGELFA